MKQTLELIFGIGILAVFALSILLFVDSDSTEVPYTYPTEGIYLTFAVDETKNTYTNSVYEATDYYVSDEEKQALFEEYRQQQNWAAEYNEARNIAEGDGADDFQEREEDRIEDYCDEEGYLSCYNIAYTCQEYTCYLVTITCEENGYDPQKEITWGQKYGCDEWDVNVDTDDFDIRDVDESYWEGYGYKG